MKRGKKREECGSANEPERSMRYADAAATAVEQYEARLKTGIERSKEFERKGLAQFAVNIGTKCGHGCLYCSTGALLRMHSSFSDIGVSAFEEGYSIVDPSTPERVANHARRKRKRGMIQLCTTVDAWSPEAQEHQLGRRCLEAILVEPDWTVRILTKNAAVLDDFDFISDHKDRILVGISITATPDKAGVISVIEPNASPLDERMEVMREAHRRGLRTYAMFCPLLPGIADSEEAIEELVRFAVEIGAEEIYAEPVNPRGNGLIKTLEALSSHGYDLEADAVGGIRKRTVWSTYVADLTRRVQQAVRKYSDIDRLRFLLYPKDLSPGDRNRIKEDDRGIIWL